jgi:hypothetical protein
MLMVYSDRTGMTRREIIERALSAVGFRRRRMMDVVIKILPDRDFNRWLQLALQEPTGASVYTLPVPLHMTSGDLETLPTASRF